MLSQNYKEYADIFLKEKAIILSEIIRFTHIISIKKNKNVLYKSIYSLTANKLKVLYNYFNSNLVKS